MSTLRAKAPMHKNRNTTLQRISGYISKDNLWSEINLWSQLYGEAIPFQSLEVWSLPDPALGAWKDYTFDQIVGMPFVPAAIGDSFGPTWSTHWFKIVVAVPAAWNGREVHLRWVSGSEATLWSAGGEVLQGLSSQDRGRDYRSEYIIAKSWPDPEVGPGPVTFYLEMVASFAGGNAAGALPIPYSSIRPPDPNRTFTIQRAEVSVFNRQHFNLYTDLEVLYGIANGSDIDSHIAYQALFAANEMVTLIKDGELDAAGVVSAGFFAERNGQKAHTLIAMGHCHIDTAWLWPYDETIRKVARSWSSQLGLLREYPEFTFVCSSAQQYAWLKEWYPGLFDRLKDAVSEGRFIPVGGAWLENDGNIPSGEGFLRQFFYGQRFFRDEFGLMCREFFLPDTFGYSAQIPQMMKHCGMERFVTQKISWNLVNKFPNHNFWWEGIDGSQVLVHFPPGDSYNMLGNVNEMLFSRSNSEDKGRANVAMYLYGFGDGGGGPTREMIERQIRCRDVDGLPRVQFGSPEDFWGQLEREEQKLYKWVGELYLELHNGTYTTQAKIKWYNRKGEIFFREVELLLAIAYVTGKVTQAKLEADVAILDTNWKLLLLNQFHDVLPGTSIEMAIHAAWAIYEQVFVALTSLRSEYHALNLGPGAIQYVYNALSWAYDAVIFQNPDSGTPPTGPNTQVVTLRAEPFEESTEGRYRVPATFTASLVHLQASGYTPYVALAPGANAVVYSSPEAGLGQLSNGLVRLEFPLTGGAAPAEALYLIGGAGAGPEWPVYRNRASVEPPTAPGQLYIYDDVPIYWDAWDVMDYHLETKKPIPLTAQTNPVPFAEGPIVGGYKWTGTFGAGGSTFERYSFLRAGSPLVEYLLVIDWKEEHKFLKVEWPVDILARDATFEIQYGHAKRPTHINTSWDMAKFEVCAHKWVDISQRGRGVTFISDAKYGWHVRDNVVSLSLLKSPKNPDPNCDMHTHYIQYAVLPHEGTFQEAGAIQRAYELNYYGANNVPLLTGAATPSPAAGFVTVSHPGIIVGAFKAAHDEPGSVVVRLYEAFGGGVEVVTISLGFTITAVNEADGLERVGDPVPVGAGNTFSTSFRPFQLRTFIVAFQG